MATLDVSTRLDGDNFVVESVWETNQILNASVSYDANVQVSGTSQVLRASDTVDFANGSVNSVSRFPLGDLGVSPGETVDLFVTVIYINEGAFGSEDLTQEQFSETVTRPSNNTGGSGPSLSDLELNCLGVSPQNPPPGGTLSITLEAVYTGSASYPTITLDTKIGGVSVGNASQRIAASSSFSSGSTFTIDVPVPSSASVSAGETVGVNVEAIDISQ